MTTQKATVASLVALTLLTLANALNFADRLALAVLVEPIKLEFHLSDTQIGLATGLAFSILYALLGLPIARWADVGIRRNIIGLAMAVWGVAVIACGFVQNYAQLLAARVFVGVGDAGAVSPSYSLLADYFDRHRRVTAISLLTAGGAAGAAAGTALTGLIAETWNWRAAFWFIGTPGLLLALALRFLIREPLRGGADGVPATGGAQENWRRAVATILRTTTYRRILLGGGLLSFFVYGMGLWTPAFYMRSHHMTVAEVGIWIGTIGGVSGIVATVLGGTLAQWLSIRDERWILWFSAVTTVTALPFMAVSLLVDSRAVSLATMLLGQTIASLAIGPMLGQVPTVVAQRERAIASAMISAIFSLVGLSLSGVVIGVVSDALATSLGPNALRSALLYTLVVPLAAGAVLFTAAQHVVRDAASALARSMAEA